MGVRVEELTKCVKKTRMGPTNWWKRFEENVRETLLVGKLLFSHYHGSVNIST